MLVSTNYGYFRDELYYIEAGRRLAFGYVDFPPLVALVARFLDVVAGDALWTIHLVPALATAQIVLLTGLMSRELGGGHFAQALAALASLVAVTFLATEAGIRAVGGGSRDWRDADPVGYDRPGMSPLEMWAWIVVLAALAVPLVGGIVWAAIRRRRL